MLRTAIIIFALTAAPALATAHFSAQPANAPMLDRIVLRNAVWKRTPTGYEAPKSNSRPAVICAAFAKSVGALKSFSIAGAPISADNLEKCNARAAR